LLLYVVSRHLINRLWNRKISDDRALKKCMK
jgi:hypothetical protein